MCDTIQDAPRHLDTIQDASRCAAEAFCAFEGLAHQRRSVGELRLDACSRPDRKRTVGEESGRWTDGEHAEQVRLRRGRDDEER